MVGPPNLDKLIQSLENETKRLRGNFSRPYVNPNIFVQHVLGSRDPMIQANGLKVELEFTFSEQSDCKSFITYAEQEFEKAQNANQVGELRGYTDPAGKVLHISCLWIDQ